jgi:hypothetical protein
MLPLNMKTLCVEFGRILLAEGGDTQGNSGQFPGEMRPIRHRFRSVSG